MRSGPLLESRKGRLIVDRRADGLQTKKRTFLGENRRRRGAAKVSFDDFMSWMKIDRAEGTAYGKSTPPGGATWICRAAASSSAAVSRGNGYGGVGGKYCG